VTEAGRDDLEGDSEGASAFEAFFRAEHPRLLRALYLLTGNLAEADDLAQEAMARAYERWGRVGAMDSPVGYVYRTALNLHRSRVRRLAFRGRRRVEGDLLEDPIERVETRAEILRLLSRLPAGQREALVLVGWLGMTSEEAGAVLGIEPVSVRVRLARARAALHERQGGTDA
jgi:RNA polymerase sigma factor (sigma-70 family)